MQAGVNSPWLENTIPNYQLNVLTISSAYNIMSPSIFNFRRMILVFKSNFLYQRSDIVRYQMFETTLLNFGKP